MFLVIAGHSLAVTLPVYQILGLLYTKDGYVSIFFRRLSQGYVNFKKLLGFMSFFNDPVRLGTTEPTGPGGKNSIEKWTIE